MEDETALHAQNVAADTLAKTTSRYQHEPAFDSHELPIVVVGNGPVGMRVVSELLDRMPETPIVIYGEETHQPYDRVRLSSWLCGELPIENFVKPFRRPFGSRLDQRYGFRVASIDRASMSVTDSAGHITRFSHLILATGSRAFVPEINGIDAEGVFTLRNLDDATKLMGRRIRSRHTVIIGGGLLGLETARGMQAGNIQVTVIEHSDRLMANQLDLEAATMLRENVEALGFSVVVGDGIKSIQGSPRVDGITLRSGTYIPCDTVVLATDIRPNIDLATQARLAFGKGIQVNDQMRTSHPKIYAIGECAEHQGEVYGLVAPGFEHASVAASAIAGKFGKYTGSMAASRLKVVGTDVFSVGPMGHRAHPLAGQALTFRDPENNYYRKLLIRRHRLIGAISIGKWPQTVRLQSAIAENKYVFPWQQWRFKYSGDLWAANQANHVAQWPEQTTVCQCTGVNRGKLSDAIFQGVQTVEDLGKTCGAGTVCGSCKPLLASLLGQQDKNALITGVKPLLIMTLFSLLAVLSVLLAPVLPYAVSVQPLELLDRTFHWHWDSLWRESLNKQITGFSILGSALIASFLSLRKRVKRMHGVGTFDTWRLLHLALSLVALTALLLHTGFRMGHGLNFALMSLFVALIVLGCVSALMLGIGHKLPQSVTDSVKRHSIQCHIYLVWPIPALLGWHIFKGYWY